MNLPVAGEIWIKPSFPIPTVVSIIEANRNDMTVKLKWGRKRPVTMTIELFLAIYERG